MNDYFTEKNSVEIINTTILHKETKVVPVSKRIVLKSTTNTYYEERKKHTEKLSLLQKTKNATAAIRKIVASGGKIVDKQTRLQRGKICENCPFWLKDGNMGLGECTKCGCTKYKRLFEAQSCPLGKW